MSVYAWCEDSSSGFEFWVKIFGTLYPDIVVESKKNNTQLRKAAAAVTDDGNEYYVLMDSFVDNANVLRELDGLKKGTSGKKNVHLIDIRSFEFVLITFQLLIEWIFAEQDDLKESRKDLIDAKNLFLELNVTSLEMDKRTEFEELFPYAKTHNNEQIAAELLYQLTRNTGFETKKGKLGECFVNNCCEWTFRASDDVCGLDEDRITATEKINRIFNLSILKNAFEKAGL